MKKTFYITTPIYYPSANLHIGHAYCTSICDVIARYKKLRGYDVFFLTGADEHGLKIEKNAQKANKSPQEFVDEIVLGFKDLWSKLDISNDIFMRTTNPSHVQAVQKIFSRLLKQGDIYLSKYEGWYCDQCESFWTETQVGSQHLCPDCGRPVNKATEEAYFFRTSKYLNRLLDLYELQNDFLLPINRKNEIFNTFIKPGLEDLCISRTSFKWGIQVLENPNHVIYVWLDALSNYITALGYNSEDDSLFQKYWMNKDGERLHILGADINRFHSIYWPMFLMALDLPLPSKEFVHGLLMTKDGKMSKSKGNVISPFPLIDKYGSDALRYYFSREIIFGSDGQFTPEQFIERINADLANVYGNLLNRTVTMVEKYFGGTVPSYRGLKSEYDKELEEETIHTISKYEQLMDCLDVSNAIDSVISLLSQANKYIDLTTPWVLAKDATKKDILSSVLSHLVNVIYVSTILLSPILTKTSVKAFDQLGVPLELRHYDKIRQFGIIQNVAVKKSEPLFPRLDLKENVDYIVSKIK